MKKMKKCLLVAACTVLAGSMVALSAACKDDKKDSDEITLKFETNGGSKISKITEEAGATVALPVPEREGYRFDGWYLNAEFEGKPVTEIVVEEDTTYYAKWTSLSDLVLVTLDANGGSLSTKQVYLTPGEKVLDALKDYAPTKAGLTFGGWFYEDNEVTSSLKATEAMTLTAKSGTMLTVISTSPKTSLLLKLK